MTEPERLPKTGEKPRDIKIRNRQVILDLLCRQSKMSLGELACRCGLSRNTVKKCIDHFLQMGLVTVSGKGSSTSEGGKKPDIYGINSEWGVVCGLYHQGSDLFAALYTVDLRLLGESHTLIPESCPPAELASQTGEAVRALLCQCGCRREQLKSVTMAYHGVVDYFTGTVLSLWGGGWDGSVPLGELISQELGGVDAAVTNAVRAMLAAETCKDEAVGENSAVIFTHEGRPMSALIREGRILQGKRCVLGEISGIPLALPERPEDEETDRLGGVGLGQLTSAPYLSEIAKKAPEFADSPLKEPVLKGQLQLPMIFWSAEKGDPLARRLLRRAAEWFAVSIRQFLFLADPNLILIQGEYAGAGAYFLSALRRYVESYAFPAVRVLPDIRLSAIREEDSATLGAASISAGRILQAENIYE